MGTEIFDNLDNENEGAVNGDGENWQPCQWAKVVSEDRDFDTKKK